MAGSTISKLVAKEVLLGSGFSSGGYYGSGTVYLSPLSITGAGTINNPGGYGILISDVANGTVTNSGSVIGIGEGIYLYQSSALIVNNGYIKGSSAALRLTNFVGGEALVQNNATITGQIGISGQEASINNSGVIYGADYGVRLQISTLANTGTIAGHSGVYTLDGTLTNHGSILGKSIGIFLEGGSAENFGSISGSLSTGARVEDEIGGGGVTIAGSLANHGSISGGIYGVYAQSGTFTNNGSVIGRIGLGVGIGGSANNTGVIYGSAYGAELFGRASMLGGADLDNASTITGHLVGVSLGINGVLDNSGYIYGQNYGVANYNGYLKNSGSILNAQIGVTLSGPLAAAENTGTISALNDGLAMSGGLVANDGSIHGANIGVFLSGGSLANSGIVTGAQYGISNSGGTVTNYNTGLIASPDYGMVVERGMVTNAGTISGGLAAIEGQFITLAVDPGAVFIGQVINSSGKSLLELAGAGLGTLGGIGTQIMGFSEISFAAGPQWSIEGNYAGLGAGKTIVGFAKGDTIVLDGFSASSEVYVKNIGLELTGDAGTTTLDITGNFNTSSFQIKSSASKTSIVNVTCFVEGTRIATPEGEMAVEALAIGDLVRTLYGGAQRVKWIGKRSYDERFIRGNKAALPVCIKAGAIADGVPARNLRVSPGHAISIDDVLVHAIRLVNGVSVFQEMEAGEITYYHVELDNHEIIFAEACPVESFMDENFRRQFQNAEAYRALYPGHVAPMVMCQPRLDSGFLLQAIARRVRARAGMHENPETGALRGYVDSVGPDICFGWAQDVAAPDMPVSLDLCCGGRRIARVLANVYREDVAQAGHGNGYQGFEFVIPAWADAVSVRRSIDGAVLEIADIAEHVDMATSKAA